jgi:hypothetical protein
MRIATIAICTRRERDGEPVEAELSLAPWEGAVLRVTPPDLEQVMGHAWLVNDGRRGGRGREAPQDLPTPSSEL